MQDITLQQMLDAVNDVESQSYIEKFERAIKFAYVNMRSGGNLQYLVSIPVADEMTRLQAGQEEIKLKKHFSDFYVCLRLNHIDGKDYNKFIVSWHTSDLAKKAELDC